MSTTSDTSFASQLYLIANNTNRYASLVIFLFGSIGAMINILIFSTDKELKKNPCSRLFLASSIASSIVLFFGLPTRFFSSFGLDLITRHDFLCKCYTFIVLSSFTCSALFTALISIERWLNSCANLRYRMFSSTININRSIGLVITIVAIAFSHIFYCYSANLQNASSSCSTLISMCMYVNNFMHLILFIIVPCILMLIFGLLTLRNVKQSLQRIANETTIDTAKTGRRTKRTQTMMTVLMFTQVALITCANTPGGIQKLYTTITVNDNRSSERRAIEALSMQWVFLLSYIGIAVNI
jgi:hypothetical protein